MSPREHAVPRSAVTVICLVTSDCNLRCRYCYTLASHQKREALPTSSVPDLIQNCSRGFDSVDFCWHGGEPLLVGKQFYEAVVAAQDEVSKRSKGRVSFVNTIQSNCLLLDDDLLKFFAAMSFRIGSTFEAPPEIHLDHRRLASGEQSRLNSYLAAFEKLKQASMPLALLCVVTKDNVRRGREIFEFFGTLGVHSYSLLPLIEVPAPNRPQAPDNDELFELYATTFDLWMKEENTFVSIEPIDTMLRSLLGERPRQCSFAASCLKRMITVAPDGTVLPCGSLTAFPLGNVFNTPLMGILHGREVLKLRKRRSMSAARFCGGCEYVSVCRGGCREIAFWNSGAYDSQFAYCEARKRSFTYIEQRTHEILQGCPIA